MVLLILVLLIVLMPELILAVVLLNVLAHFLIAGLPLDGLERVEKLLVGPVGSMAGADDSGALGSGGS